MRQSSAVLNDGAYRLGYVHRTRAIRQPPFPSCVSLTARANAGSRILYNVPRAVPLKTRRPRGLSQAWNEARGNVGARCGENESAPIRRVNALLTADARSMLLY